MNEKGFTLIELLVVIAIIGIVAAIATLNLLTALHKGKQKATMGEMRNIGTAIESYMTDMHMAPGSGGIATISGLDIYLAPLHIQVLPVKDSWGGDFHYQSGAIGPNQAIYSILSWGRSSQPGAIDIANNYYVVDKMKDFENDIVYSNGNFTYSPKIN